MKVPVGVFNARKITLRESDSPHQYKRTAMGGVEISSPKVGRGMAVATEGKVLIVAEWDDETANGKSRFAIDAKTCHFVGEIAGKSILTRKSPTVEVKGKATRPTISGESRRGPFVLISKGVAGETPKWKNILEGINKPEQVATTIRVNPRLLAKLLTTIADVADFPDVAGVDLVLPKDASDPLGIHAESEVVKIKAAIMPMSPPTNRRT